MPTELSLIVDDHTNAFTYLGGQWTVSIEVPWYKATQTFPQFAGSGTSFGSFVMTFEGTSVAFIGNTPSQPEELFQNATVSIDDGAPYVIQYAGPPPSYIQWYQSPSLPEGKHTITIGHVAGTAIDYAIVKAGQNTPLSGQTVIIDNDDPAIVYSGKWMRSTSRFSTGIATNPDGPPYGNSTHRTSNVGDTITVRFTGTALSVYGILSWASLGDLSASFTVDDAKFFQSYSVNRSTPNFINGVRDAANFVFFASDNLAAGDHTLVINITECVNQAFVFDFITYAPSFLTPSVMPNLTISTTSSAPSQTSSSTYSGTSSGSSLPSGSLVAQGTSGNKKHTPTGAIVGGVLGGLFLLALIAVFLLWRRRRNSDGRKVKNAEYNHETQNQTRDHLSPGRPDFATYSPGMISPFHASEPPSHYGLVSAADLKRHRAGPTRRSPTGPGPISTGPAPLAAATDNYDAAELYSSPDVIAPPSYKQ